MFERQHGSAAAGIFLLSALISAVAPAATVPADTTSFEDDGVVVTASRYDTDVHLSHTNLTRGELRLRRTAVDVPMMLQDIPGVYSYSDAGNGLGYSVPEDPRLRPAAHGVLVNGIPFNDPEDHQIWWVDLPDLASSIEDVQVQRGVTNSVGGMTAIGGTVNLVTDVLADEPGGRPASKHGQLRHAAAHAQVPDR